MSYGDVAPELTSLDHYRIIRKIGRGGQGDVYLAHDPHLDIDVAIKVLHAEYREPEFIRRLMLEARIMVRLSAPNIVRVYNLNPKYPYLVMEYCADGDLNQLIKSRRPLPLTRWVALARQICEALMVAHEQEDPVLHRDLKPGNVMFHKGIPKVADFGLAKVLGGASSGMTQSRGMMGTVGYSSPEQLKDASKVDHRTDIWAVGVILYELLTFRGPFERPGDDDFVNTAIRVRTEPPADPPYEIPAPLWKVIARALEKDPAARFASAREMARALDQALAAIPGADDIILPPESILGELDRLATRAADSFSSGSLADARDYVEKMKQIAPDDSLARYWERRLREVSESGSRRSDSSATAGVTDARLGSIRALLTRREYAEARRECGKILIEFPDDASVHDLLLRITEEERALSRTLEQARHDADRARADGDLAKPVEIWRGMDQRFPDHPDIRAELAVAESERRTHERRSAWEKEEGEVRALLAANKRGRALERLDEHLARFPEDSQAAGLRGSIHRELVERTRSERLTALRDEARDLERKGALERAHALWKLILDETPTDEAAHREAETLRQAIAERDRRGAIEGARARAGGCLAQGDLAGALAVWRQAGIARPGDPDVAREVRALEQQLAARAQATAAQDVEARAAVLEARVAAGRYRGVPDAERLVRASVEKARAGLGGDVDRLRAALESLAGARAAAEAELSRALDARRRELRQALDRAAEMLAGLHEEARERTGAERELDRALDATGTALSRSPSADEPGDPVASLAAADTELRRAAEALVRERRDEIEAARARATALLGEAEAAVAALRSIPADDGAKDAVAERLAGELDRLREAARSSSAERLAVLSLGALEAREEAVAVRAGRACRLSAELGRLLDESLALLTGPERARLRTLARSAAAALDGEGAEVESARVSLCQELRAELAAASKTLGQADAAARSAWSAAAREAEALPRGVPEPSKLAIDKARRDGESALAASRLEEVKHRAAELLALARAARLEAAWDAERRAVEALEGPIDEHGLPARAPGPDDAKPLARFREAVARGASNDLAALARDLRGRAERVPEAGDRAAAPPVPEIDARVRRLNERLHLVALERFDRDAAAYRKAREAERADLPQLAAAAARSHEALLRPAAIWPRLAAAGAAVLVLAAAATFAIPRQGATEVTLVSPAGDVRIAGVSRDGRDVTARIGSATTVTALGVRWQLEPGSYVVTTEQGAEVRFEVPASAAVFVPTVAPDPTRELIEELGLEELMND